MTTEIEMGEIIKEALYNVADCLEIYLSEHTTKKYIESVFKFYNQLYR